MHVIFIFWHQYKSIYIPVKILKIILFRYTKMYLIFHLQLFKLKSYLKWFSLRLYEIFLGFSSFAVNIHVRNGYEKMQVSDTAGQVRIYVVFTTPQKNQQLPTKIFHNNSPQISDN